MRLCSNLRVNVAFIVNRISERPDVQDKWFNASIDEIMYDVGFGTKRPHIN